jgi:hypothetical protein
LFTPASWCRFGVPSCDPGPPKESPHHVTALAAGPASPCRRRRHVLAPRRRSTAPATACSGSSGHRTALVVEPTRRSAAVPPLRYCRRSVRVQTATPESGPAHSRLRPVGCGQGIDAERTLPA